MYDLTNFKKYVSQSNETLTATLFAGSDTLRFARLVTGVKGKTTVPHIDGGAKLQKGNCPAPDGSTIGLGIELEVTPFTMNEQYCQDDLQDKFPNTVLAPGSSNRDAPKHWEDALVDAKIASVNEQLEEIYWTGDKSTDLFDGFIKQIDASGKAVDGNLSEATEFTKENVIGLVEDMRTAAPAKVKRAKNFVIAVGDDIFDMYILALKTANLYHYAPEHDNGEYRIGGTGAMLERVYGLNETQRMFASTGHNFIVGADVEDEKDLVHFYYDETTDKVGMRIKGKAGVAIANPEEIVQFSLTV